MDSSKKLQDWLKDLHAIKLHTAKLLAEYAAETKSQRVGRAIAAHARRTRAHLKQIERELSALGQSPSAFGGAVAKILGMGQGAASRFLGDRVLTIGAGALALEELEVVTLGAIAAAAREAKQPRCAKACEAMAADDERFRVVFGKAFPSLASWYLRT